MRHFVGMPASRWLAGAGLASVLSLAPQHLSAEEGAAAIFRSGRSVSMPASPRPTSNALELFSPSSPAARPQPATETSAASAFPAAASPTTMPGVMQSTPATVTLSELDSFRALPSNSIADRSGFPNCSSTCEANCDRPAAFPIASPAVSVAGMETDHWQARPVTNVNISPAATTAAQMETDDFRPYHEKPAIWNTAAPVPAQRAPFHRAEVSEPSVTHGHFESFDRPAAMPGSIQQVSAVSGRDFFQTQTTLPTTADAASVDQELRSQAFDDRTPGSAETAPSSEVRRVQGGAMLLQPISTAPLPEVVRPAATPQFGGAWTSSGKHEWRSVEAGPHADASSSMRKATVPPVRPSSWEAGANQPAGESPFGASHGAFRPQ